jgi:hypothetical protein
MARYSLFIFCDECRRIHSTRISLNLDNGPPKKETVADAYKDKPLPRNLVKLLGNAVLCPESARSLMLKDSSKVYLVPTD